MTYVVQNQANFQSAYAGAMAGFGFGGRYPSAKGPEDFAVFTAAAANSFAFASALDTLLGAGVDEFLSTLVFSCSVSAFQARSPDSDLDNNDFLKLANAVFAAYEAAVEYAGGQGVTPSSGNQSVVKQIQSDIAGSFGDITEGNPA